jgi:hypothetical protein
VRVFVGHRASVTALAISPDGRYLASGGMSALPFFYTTTTNSIHLHTAEELSIILWDLSSGRQVKSMTGHTSSINSLSFSAESTVLVSGSSDGTVRVWDVLASSTSASDSTALTTIKGRKSGEKSSEQKLAEKMRMASAAQDGGSGDNRAASMTGLLPKASIIEKEILPSYVVSAFCLSFWSPIRD